MHSGEVLGVPAVEAIEELLAHVRELLQGELHVALADAKGLQQEAARVLQVLGGDLKININAHLECIADDELKVTLTGVWG